MLRDPNCWKRRCTFYIGVYQPDGTEKTEVHACKAFPAGIPFSIAYGKNLHLKEVQGDNGIRYAEYIGPDYRNDREGRK